MSTTNCNFCGMPKDALDPEAEVLVTVGENSICSRCVHALTRTVKDWRMQRARQVVAMERAQQAALVPPQADEGGQDVDGGTFDEVPPGAGAKGTVTRIADKVKAALGRVPSDEGQAEGTG